MWRRLIISAVLLAGVTVAGPADARAREPAPQPSTLPSSLWKRAFAFDDKRIDESSGLFASNGHPGVIWTFNDKKGPVRLYAVGPDGKTQAVVTLDGHEGVDPEAMGGAVGLDGTNYLYVGDIGGNPAPRPDGIVVYQLVEPAKLADASVEATAYKLTYPDGLHDAETLLVDPRTRELYVVTKGPQGGNIYRAPADLSETRPNMLTWVRELPYVISDGLIAPNGDMILRSYNKVRIWKGVEGALTSVLDIPQQEQGEGIAITPDGKSLLISSEGPLSPVWRMDLPAELGVHEPAPPDDTAVSALEEEIAGMPLWLWGAGGGVVALLLAAGLVVVMRRESRAW
ncbi:hypothetical protein [Microtetraspora sp. NBRC 16547]|uniref:hypothetical protein n=1 Tax=Microtetraspora sp. NBRC 16547 TaxID=3030993 RepID=UPI0024A4CE8B|nr:hypothetical protein [Microtetraspora sp. NBRC 16547]GLW99545.1 hypothetical protein Misp02_36320 [Microtetraspora sp. NBRC 16547]